MMNWNIAESIPETSGCRDSFNAIIAGYVHAIYMKHTETLHEELSSTSCQSNVVGTTIDVVLDYAKELILGEISQNLFRITERINTKMSSLTNVKNESIALEFVKIVCHVLSLDKSLKDEVQQVKSNLLRLIGVNEYSEMATWKDNTKTYVLPQVICKVCNNCRDIDLRRDVHCGEGVWLCPLCKTAYDNLEIEHTLLEVINRQMLTYNLQDLQCQKCRMIKRENLPKLCECSGEFLCIINRNDIIDLLHIFKEVSSKFNLYVLNETTDTLLFAI